MHFSDFSLYVVFDIFELYVINMSQTDPILCVKSSHHSAVIKLWFQHTIPVGGLLKFEVHNTLTIHILHSWIFMRGRAPDSEMF